MNRRVAVMVLGLALLAMTPALAKVNVKSLEGNTYFCTIIRSGEANGRAEQLTFTKNLMQSGFFARFGDALYRMAPNDKGTSTNFVAETRNGREGKIKWYGAVLGNNIEGTCIWYKHNQIPLVYIVKGTLKPKAKA